MRHLTKIFALFLALILLAGCGSGATAGNKKKTFTAELNEQEMAVSEFLKGVYCHFTADVFTTSIYDTTDVVNTALTTALTAQFGEAPVLSDLLAKDLGNFDDIEVYAVAALCTKDGVPLTVNDVLLVGEDEDVYTITLQQLFGEEAQEDIIDCLDSFSSYAKQAFSVCNEKLGGSDAVSTVLSIADHTIIFTDEVGNTVTGASGVITDIGGQLNRHHDAANPNGEDDDNGDDSPSGTVAPQTRSDGRKLTWNCEFDFSSAGEMGNYFNTGYTAMGSQDVVLRTDAGNKNIFVDNGVLHLRMTPNGDGTYTTSNTLSTYQKMSYRYGYLEIRAQVPFRRGMWPSYWMQSDANLRKSSYMGEIDIFEVFGSDTLLASAMHKWKPNNHDSIGAGTFSFSSAAVANNWHTYALEWTDSFMKYYVDGNCYSTIKIDDASDTFKKVKGMEVFHDYYFVIFNNWVFYKEGNIGGSSQFVENYPITENVDYKIDYVRLYQYASSNEALKVY